MKKYLVIIFLFSAMLTYSQKKENVSANNYRFEQSLITPNFEKFDSLTFESLKKKKKDIVAYGNLEDGRNIIFRNLSSGKDYSEAIINSFLYKYKSYYLNNNIAAKGLSFIYHGFRVGVWYYFNEDGTLKETVDHDKPFKFTLEQIFEFCGKEKIPIKKEWDKEADGFYRTGINRIYNPEKGECYWIIDWFDFDIRKVVKIYLDGVTGKETKRDYMDYVI